MGANADLAAWKEYLQYDPTRFLFQADAPPSIWLGYMLDIANRPEESQAAVETRERVLFSDTVQQLLAAQNGSGYWGKPESPVEPLYTATLWNLALLAELGIPRASRRARAALEYLLDSYGSDREAFQAPASLAGGHLARAAAYFRYASDPRVQGIVRDLENGALGTSSLDPSLALLWALGRWPEPLESQTRTTLSSAIERLLDTLASRREGPPLVFPHFGTRDDLFLLRILAEYGRAGDPRTGTALARFIARQDRQARWPLDQARNDRLLVPLEEPSETSRWITLNALRVIKSLVTHSPSTASGSG